jgi:hypothetical protein
MARWGTKLAGSMLALIACTPTEFIRVPADATAGTDRPMSTDAGDGGRVVADAGTDARCTTDRECTEGVCDLGTQRCVQCVDSAQCMSGAVCLGSRCVQAPTCTTSRTCPGQVCSTRLGVCVDCETDTDCSGGQVCRRNVCAPPPRTCMSSRECSDLGQVCDTARRLCVECLGENDCAPEQHCGGQNLCLADFCVAGATRCADLVSQMTCDSRGVAETASRCPSGQTCRTNRCEVTSCAPGTTRCASSGMLETCATDGNGFTATACGSQQSCSGGRCVTWMCTPGARVCLDATRVNVCDPDGLSATPMQCPSGAACQTGQCVARSCIPGATSCADTATRSVCNNDGRTSTNTPCPSGQRCESGVCRAMTCVPGTTVCGEVPGTLSVCNAEGTASSTFTCPMGANTTGTTCSGGSCGIVCASGFGNCDGSAINGCEADLTSNASHCGACGISCSSCSGSRCASTSYRFSEYFGRGDQQPICDSWRRFLDRIPLDGTASIEINGSEARAPYVCTDPVAVRALAAAMRSRSSAQVNCGGYRWSFCPRTDGEIAIDLDYACAPQTCSARAIVRPCRFDVSGPMVGSPLSGVDTSVCQNIPPQQISVELR